MSDPIQEIARQLHIQTLGDGLLAKIRQTIDLLQEAAVERDALRAEAAALRAENARLQNALLEVTARRFAESWKKRTSDADLEQYLSAGIAQLEAERDALRQQRDKLAQVLGNVEREHELIRQMKNCEIHRGRGSFGIAVMSDPLALDWQALDKALQQLVDARRAALAETNRA